MPGFQPISTIKETTNATSFTPIPIEVNFKSPLIQHKKFSTKDISAQKTTKNEVHIECAVCARRSVHDSDFNHSTPRIVSIRTQVLMMLQRKNKAKKVVDTVESLVTSTTTDNNNDDNEQKEEQWKKEQIQKNFIIIPRPGAPYQKNRNRYRKKMKGVDNTQRHCCFDCFDFFRKIAIIRRDQRIQPHISCQSRTGNCSIGPLNDQNLSQVNCPSCWLDRCALVGLRAIPFAFIGAKWIPKKSKLRVERFDETLEKRCSIILKNNIEDERFLDFGLLETMIYINKEIFTLRMAASKRVRNLFNMVHSYTTIDLIKQHGRGPLLLGSSNGVRMLVSGEDDQCYSMVTPTSISYHSLEFPTVVTIYLEQSDPFFLYPFFNCLDVFLVYELSHSMPIFHLLDVKDKILQCTFTAILSVNFGKAAYSASINSPTLIFPGGYLPLQTITNAIAKIRKAMAEGEHRLHSAIIDNQLSRNLLPMKVLNHPQLIDQMEQYARRFTTDFVEPFLQAKLCEQEVYILRAMIITSPRTPGLSEKARFLLEIEWKKYAKILQNLLLHKFGSVEQADRRFELLRKLIEEVVDQMTITEFCYSCLYSMLCKVPLHNDSFEEKNQSGRTVLPGYLSDIIKTYEFAFQCKK